MIADLLRRLFRGTARRPAPLPVAPPSSAPSLPALSERELLALENAGVPTVERRSDAAEAMADEAQNPETSLNFPLHWTSAAESWTYLFDLSIACDLLAPRPDDLVLDFAAGTCWASECLLRLGVRPVAVDLSLEMMRRGRQRLDADNRLVFRDQAFFITARGQQLPFRSETFDGVVCMNALHHLPSYAEALAEIYRVLKPGGRAVFSEPGTEHAGQSQSRFRMREEQVIEKSVSLPLIRHLAIRAGFTRMRVVPLRASGTYAFDYSAAADDDQRLRDIWAETSAHSASEHARFILFKGDAPPQDTFLPAQLLGGRLRADIGVAREHMTARPESRIVERLRITNTGTVTWKARGRRFGGQVTCGLKIFEDDGTLRREDLGRTPLSRDVAPGDTIDVDMVLEVALPVGGYRLRYDMVVEGVSWFEHHGSPTPERRLTVTATPP